MIDIHCHILPGIDDGSKDMETSVQMCRIAQMNGIKHIVATPHINTVDNIERFLEARNEKVKSLQEQLDKRQIPVKIYPGAEVYVDDDIFFANDLKRLAINNSHYILIEFAFYGLKISRIVDYINEILHAGLIPIIAHPERYEYFQLDYEAINMLAKNGVVFQINAPSLASLDGPQEFELSYAMAYNGISSFIATDAHSTTYRPNNLLEMMNFFPPDISQFNMQMMVHDSAKSVLTDEPLPVINRGVIHKRGF